MTGIRSCEKCPGGRQGCGQRSPEWVAGSRGGRLAREHSGSGMEPPHGSAGMGSQLQKLSGCLFVWDVSKASVLLRARIGVLRGAWEG